MRYDTRSASELATNAAQNHARDPLKSRLSTCACGVL